MAERDRGATARRHINLIERRNGLGILQRQAHCDWIAIAFIIAERPRAFAGQRETDNAPGRTRRNIEQCGLAFVDLHVQIEPVGCNRVYDIAGARNVVQHGLDTSSQLFQHFQIGPDNAKLDRRVNRCAILEQDQLDARAANLVELLTQTVDHFHAFLTAPTIHDGKDFPNRRRFCRFKTIVENRRIFAPDIFSSNFNRGFLG